MSSSAYHEPRNGGGTKLRQAGLLWTIGLVVAASASVRAQSTAPIEGKSVDATTAYLGQPSSVDVDATGTRVLVYETGDERLRLYVERETVSVFKPPSLGRIATPANAKALAGLAKKRGASGDVWGALEALNTCYEKSSTDRSCLNEALAIATTQWNRVTPTIGSASEADLMDVHRLFEAFHRVSPTVQRIVDWRDAIAQKLIALSATRIASIRQTFVERQISSAAAAAAMALRRKDFGEVARVAATSPPDPRISAILADATQQAEASAKEGIAVAKSFSELSAAAERVSAAEPLLGTMRSEELRKNLFRTIGERLQQVAGIRTLTPMTARVLREYVPVEIATLLPLRDDNRWSEVLAGVNGRLPVRLEVRVNTGCGDLPAETVRTGLQLVVPGLSFVSTEADFELTATADCAAAITRGEPVERSSVYQASFQQVVNTDYIQLQTQLDAAQVHLAQVRLKWALNPPQNTWSGVAKGIEEGAAIGAVNSLTGRLRETPPLLQRPIEAPYTFEETPVSKDGIVAIDLELKQVGLNRVTASEIRLRASDAGHNVSGVLPTDTQGNINKPAGLIEDSALFAQALEKDIPTLMGAREVVTQGIFIRLEELGSTLPPIDALGLLLFARDYAGDALPSKHQAVLAPLGKLTVSDLSTLKLSFPARETAKPAVSAAKTPPVRIARASQPTSPPKVSRAEMIQSALEAVVTVETDKGSGSGFFVGSGGQLVTNAHVLEGATRIRVRTTRKDVFLASVVRSDSAADLALLRVSGYEGPSLQIAESDDEPVGSDVIAMGSPLGLEGTVTRGIISARRSIAGVAYVQIDAAINPGNSGGPLLTDKGVVIGVNTWKVGANRTESLGFAIAASVVNRVLASYLAP